MSVPGVFAPLELDGRILGDGGLVNNLPVDVARRMGADVIIAVDIYCGKHPAPRGNAVDTVLKTLRLQSCQLSNAEIAELWAATPLDTAVEIRP